MTSYKFRCVGAVPTIFVALFAVLSSASPAVAYVGPGAGLSAIGSLLALVAAIAFAIIGFLWFPVRRRLRQRRQAAEAQSAIEKDRKTD